MFNKILISVLSTIFVCFLFFYIYTKYTSSIYTIGEIQGIKWKCDTLIKKTNMFCQPMVIGKTTTVTCNPQTNYVLVNTNSGDGINYQCVDNGNNVFKVNYYVWFKIYDYKVVNYETESREEIIKINSQQKWLLHMNKDFEIRSIQ